MRGKKLLWLLAIPVALVALVSAGIWGYINVIREDAPERFTVDAGATPGATTDTTAGGAATPEGVEGAWKVTTGSQAGYRVKEVIAGQSAEGVGRTTAVTGQFTVAGAAVTAGSFSVDMTKVTSDEARRDEQFNSRIMSVNTYPTATFVLRSPIQLASVPGVGSTTTATATGDLTLRGVTKPVTFSLQAQRAATSIQVAGSIPILFADYAIPNPSIGPVTTEDRGELEFLLVFGR